MSQPDTNDSRSENTDDSDVDFDRDDEKTLADMVVDMRKKALAKKKM